MKCLKRAKKALRKKSIDKSWIRVTSKILILKKFREKGKNMTLGVGGENQQDVLNQLEIMNADVQPIKVDEYRQRIKRAQVLMRENNLKAIYINAGTNLYYFTGTKWYASERLVGAIIPVDGEIEYIAPYFEVNTLNGFTQINAKISAWQEDENPYQLVIKRLQAMGFTEGQIGIDESAAFFIFDGLAKASSAYNYQNAKLITAGCRMIKSANEIALMQLAKNMTMEVHKAAAKILRPGISTQEVTQFINKAHQKVGASGSFFCIVLFGVDSSFPHGVKTPKNLAENDIVLIDTGCTIEGYNSDITRTYVFGEANQYQREMWAHEKEAQAQAFSKAQLGVTCGEVDTAARDYLTANGFGPDYHLPGLPHRTGHGCGLDIHEWPYLVKNCENHLHFGAHSAMGRKLCGGSREEEK